MAKKFLFYSFYIFCCIFTFVLQINSSKKWLHMQSCCFPYYPVSFWRSRFRRRRVCLISGELNRLRLWVCLTFINWLHEILICSFFSYRTFPQEWKKQVGACLCPVRWVLRPVQTDASLANNSHHCWMLHVASVCTPCCMLLDVVAQSLKPVKLFSQQLPTILFFRDRRSVAQQCWIRLHSLLHVVACCWELLRRVLNRSNFWAGNSQHFFTSCSVIAEA